MTRQELEQIYDYAGNFHEGRAWVELNGKCGHVDENGKITTPIIYDSAGNFYIDRTWVELNGKQGYVDKNGNLETKYRKPFIRAVFK